MKPLTVLSLFDGISCGQLALHRANIPVGKYYASEIDKYAIQVTMKNWPNTVQLGDVTKIDFKQFAGKIDLLIGGSPCQSLSITNSKHRKHLDGESRLFWEYIRALREVKPKWFFFENVESMTDECKQIISKELGVEPIFIDSSCLSAQERPRYYWCNFGVKNKDLFGNTFFTIPYPENKGILLEDVLEKDVDDKFYYKEDFDFYGIDKWVCANLHINGHEILKRVHSPKAKCPTLTCCSGGSQQKKVYDIAKNKCRKLTPIEYERAQTLPDNYTDCISNSQRYNCIGNGWTVDVIAYIFSFMKED